MSMLNPVTGTSRRGFLKSVAAAGAVLTIGLDANGAMASGEAVFNPFVTIDADGVVHVAIKHFEMGQGTTTGLATLVADELDADWAQVRADLAPGDGARYANLFFGIQGTGGSTAMANSFMQYRTAAAAARAVLVQAAAEAWGVKPADVAIEAGVLRAGARSAGFGDMAAAAARLTPPEAPALKDPSQFRLIGLDGLTRKDSAAKTDGTAEFAIDVRVPGMVTAVILRSPRFGGRLVEFDASAVDAAGFVAAHALPNGAGVAVFGRNSWAAIRAREQITATWDDSAAETRSTDALAEAHFALLDAPTWQARPGGDFAATEMALAGAERLVQADFLFPNLAHAPMEPLNCVIEPTAAGGVRFHDGCQLPGVVQPTVAAVLGLDPAQVEVRTVYAGGSFGRRGAPSADYQVEAAMAFDLLGRRTPVRLLWTREDDLAGGLYRPMAVHRARIGLDADGRIVGWDHRIAAKPIMKGGPFEMMVDNGVDPSSVEGAHDSHYAIPAFSVGLSDAHTPTPVLWWRAVGHSHTAYAMESLIDMAAHEAGEDPVAYRLRLLAGEGADSRRLSAVLRLAAEKAGWGAPAPGRHQGVAVHRSFRSYVAQVVEVSLTDVGAVKLERVVVAVDCGLPVNPDVIRAQMEGGVGYGLGHVMRNKITMTDGVVDQWNFPDYEPLRITDMPAVEVHILPSTEPPTGVGEPGLPPAGPALANAIFAAAGVRVTTLPMTDSGVTFA